METHKQPPLWQTVLAFAIIYLVWGSTFLAIRIGVHEVPPFLLASMRFLLAGGVLLAWTIARREPLPTPRQWLSAVQLAVLIFVIDYGLLFWAERRVPSGIAAVMMASIPVFMALSEIVFLRTQRLTGGLALSLLIGVIGVAVLMAPSLDLGGAAIDTLGACALLIAAISWSISSALTRKLPLPSSKPVSSGSQMFAGGVMLAATAAALGELRDFHPQAVSMAAWLSLAYLTVAGSIVAFTAYIWLIHHQPPTRVGTYAYVNPVVAVIVGYFLGGEPMGMRTVAGSLCVLASVVLLTTARTKKA